MPNELPPRDEYLPRIVDDQVRRYLEIFGAVEVAGTKWCGKTWTACRHGESVSYVDDALALAQSDPQAMLAGEQPHVIDEWQLAPAIWNTVRHAVDRKRGLRGAWLLTGSSTPLAKDEDQARAMHSGAGRIGRASFAAARELNVEFRDLLTKELTFVATQLSRLLRHHGPRLLAAEALSELVAVGCGHFPAHVAALAGAHAAPVHGAGNLVEIGPQVRTLARGHLGPLADAWRLDLLTVVPDCLLYTSDAADE